MLWRGEWRKKVTTTSYVVFSLLSRLASVRFVGNGDLLNLSVALPILSPKSINIFFPQFFFQISVSAKFPTFAQTSFMMTHLKNVYVISKHLTYNKYNPNKTVIGLIFFLFTHVFIITLGDLHYFNYIFLTGEVLLFCWAIGKTTTFQSQN